MFYEKVQVGVVAVEGGAEQQITVHLAQVVIDERHRDRLEMIEVDVRGDFRRQHRPQF